MSEDPRYCTCCGAPTRVVDSRGCRGYVRRRRLCTRCDHRSTSIEMSPESNELMVITRDGHTKNITEIKSFVRAPHSFEMAIDYLRSKLNTDMDVAMAEEHW